MVTVATLGEGVEPQACGEGLAAQWRVVPRAVPGDADAFDLVGPEATLQLRGALPGDYNRANTAFAALALLELGWAPSEVEAALAAGARVPGRMERVDAGPGAPAVYVDFAHTPEAVKATLGALRAGLPKGGRLVAVVGAGGHRDRGKRPLMGRAAALGADLVVITDDNPRDEDPALIRREVAQGALEAYADSGRERDRVRDVEGREAGIAAALDAARAHDIVAVLGRGHETRQEVMGEFLPFDDRQAVRTAWARLGRADVGAGAARA